MGGGFHFVDSWDVYFFPPYLHHQSIPDSFLAGQTGVEDDVVFLNVLVVSWMFTPSFFTISPSLPKATTTPLSTVRGRSCNLQKQVRIANLSPCMRARMVPGI